jgi:hypothetical protein
VAAPVVFVARAECPKSIGIIAAHVAEGPAVPCVAFAVARVHSVAGCCWRFRMPPVITRPVAVAGRRRCDPTRDGTIVPDVVLVAYRVPSRCSARHLASVVAVLSGTRYVTVLFHAALTSVRAGGIDCEARGTLLGPLLGTAFKIVRGRTNDRHVAVVPLHAGVRGVAPSAPFLRFVVVLTVVVAEQ